MIDAELFVGVIPSDLRRADNGKACYDYLIKLTLAARDCLVRLQDHMGKDDDRVSLFWQVHGE
jgi:hypothetical protein